MEYELISKIGETLYKLDQCDESLKYFRKAQDFG